MAVGDTALNEIWDNPVGEFNPATHVKRLPKFFNALTGQTAYDPSGEGDAYFGYDPTQARQIGLAGYEQGYQQQQGLLAGQAQTEGLLRDAALGRGPSVAQMQAEQAGRRAALNAQSMAAGTQGPMGMLAQREAMARGSDAMAQAASAGAQARAAEMAQARGLLSAHQGQMQSGAAGLQQQNLAMQGLLSADRQAQLDARSARQQIRSGIAGANASALHNATAGAIGGMFGGKMIGKMFGGGG